MSLKIKIFGYQKKLYEIRKKCWRQNCLSQGDIQIYFKPFFDRTRSFRFNCKKCYKKIFNSILDQIYARHEIYGMKQNCLFKKKEIVWNIFS